MSWDRAAMREDRKQAYFDSILFNISEEGGALSRARLIELVAVDLPGMGDTAWHVDRMVSAMLRGHELRRQDGLLRLSSHPLDQLNR